MGPITNKPDSEKNLYELCKESSWGNAEDWERADLALIEGSLLFGDDAKFELSSLPAIIAVSWRNYRHHIEAWVKLHSEETPFWAMSSLPNELGTIHESKYAQEFAKGLLATIRARVKAKEG